MEKIKIKPLTIDQLKISIDRLTRFKNTETKYLRVFKDILTNNLIAPKFKKSELDELDYSILRELAEKIINFSLETLNIKPDGDLLINQRLYDYEKSDFVISPETEQLLKNRINYKGFLTLLSENEVKNLLWLKELNSTGEIISLREEKSLHFPVEKVIICEGITEETLLPEFARIYGEDFEKKGIHIISAGGKNQVVKTYYQLSEILKLPIFVLLDKDASENLNLINSKLRSCDRVYILNCGEFEDLLTRNLLERTLNYAFENISLVDLNILEENLPTVKKLEEIFKHRGLHEFKKSEFANLVKINISGKEDLSEEIIKILEQIQETLLKTPK